MEEVEAVQGMARVVDAAVHMHAAGLAGVALDGGVGIDDLELVAVGRDRKVVARRDRHDGEQRAFGLPALGAAACMVMGGLALDRHRDLVVRTLAVEGAAREVRGSGLDALVD
jgi:hypothetical protein